MSPVHHSTIISGGLRGSRTVKASFSNFRRWGLSFSAEWDVVHASQGIVFMLWRLRCFRGALMGFLWCRKRPTSRAVVFLIAVEFRHHYILIFILYQNNILVLIWLCISTERLKSRFFTTIRHSLYDFTYFVKAGVYCDATRFFVWTIRPSPLHKNKTNFGCLLRVLLVLRFF